MWRKLLRAAGCLGYIALLGVLFGTVSYLAFSQFVRRGVTPTPDLQGLVEVDARSLLADQGLRVSWSEDEDRYSEEIPAGHVVLHRPPAGTLVKRGSEVTIILSRGPQMLEVPDVQGSTLQAAQVTLTAAGLTVGRVFTVFTDVVADGVIATRPAAGERLERAAAVDLFLGRSSSGTAFVMPDLVKRSYDEVRVFFENRGFRLGRVSYETYPGIAPGTVLRQFPPAGHALVPGDVIALGVVADPQGIPLDAAELDEEDPS